MENHVLENKNQIPADHAVCQQRSFYIPLDIIEKESQNDILKNLLLTCAGCYTRAGGHRVMNRTLDDHVIIYCVEGWGWLELDGKRWRIGEGDFFVCPPNIPHSYGADKKQPWTKYWIHVRGENASAYMNMLGPTLSSPILHLGENVKILSWMQDLFGVLERGYTQSNLLLATSYLSNIFSYINSQMRNKGLNKTEDMDAEKVIAYMLDNMNRKLSLDHLSRYANISKYHFVRLFKEKTGYTPVDYYIRLKIQKACHLLESSTLKINNISANLGFSNTYYFSITFKRVMGQSPQGYRERLKQDIF